MQAAASWKTLRAETFEHDRLLRLRLDAGRGNVIDLRVIAELREALAWLASERELHAWILDHEGPHFSFGASVEEHAPGRVDEMLPQFHALVRDVLNLNVPFLVCVRGKCLGGGLELAALAQRVFAAPSASFGQPEIKLGVFAPVASLVLPRRIGAQNAADLLLSGRTLESDEAMRMGLAAQIDADPWQAALEWSRKHLLTKSACALRFATQAMRQELVQSLLPTLADLEREYLTHLMATHDAREGVAAFLEKRPPVWEDR